MIDESVLLSHRDGGVLTLTLNRPRRKDALDPALGEALLNEAADRSMREALAGEARAQVVNFATADAPAAIRAFDEKRDPVFTGAWAVP
ncbi:hypothetical protein [Pseudonocardia asaccharolytica]|uniref:Enoyl-CoA hydratase n=1 Tax=Pseudonocardia asaccharolytica DSM 44247 = NBRC 16224 TaxID=1123024 RepID=A0A511D7U1_9PSEU|nr:hypothetical protein [Pseudonocardia asaccharolytica]GEL20483.1 hypothetical protein PA7_43200 [Pseudonocardia asaccharolytica DSM 44247 = NBRC 16224]